MLSRSLPLSAASDDIDSFALAVRAASDLNETNEFGRTAVFEAARLGRIEHLAILLESGADMNLTDLAGESPLEIAGVNRHPETIVFLQNAGARDSSDAHSEEKGTMGISLEATPEDLIQLDEAENELAADGPYLIRGTYNYKKAIFDLVPELASEDKKRLADLNDEPTLPFDLSGWEGSPRHGVLLKSLENGPSTLERMAYFARGYLNASDRVNWDDGVRVFGESFHEAAARFVSEGLIEIADSCDGRYQLTDGGRDALDDLPPRHKAAADHHRRHIFGALEDESTDEWSLLRAVRNLAAVEDSSGGSPPKYTIDERAFAEVRALSETCLEDLFEISGDSDPPADHDNDFEFLLAVLSIPHRLQKEILKSTTNFLAGMFRHDGDQETADQFEEMEDSELPSLDDLFFLLLEVSLIEKLEKRYTIPDESDD